MVSVGRFSDRHVLLLEEDPTLGEVSAAGALALSPDVRSRPEQPGCDHSTAHPHGTAPDCPLCSADLGQEALGRGGAGFGCEVCGGGALGVGGGARSCGSGCGGRDAGGEECASECGQGDGGGYGRGDGSECEQAASFPVGSVGLCGDGF